MPVTAIILNYGSQDLRTDNRKDSGAYVYARHVMDSVPDGSILLSNEENQVFSLWYMGLVEEADRKVAPIAVPLLQFDWYWRTISEHFPGRFQPDGPTDIPQALRSIVERNGDGTKVFFTYWDQSLDDAFVLKERAGGALLEAGIKPAP